MPHGAINIAAGKSDELAKALVAHDDVDAALFAGPTGDAATTQKASAVKMNGLGCCQLVVSCRSRGKCIARRSRLKMFGYLADLF